MTTRQKLTALVESPGFQTTVIVLILINAILLGAETFPEIRAKHGALITMLDQIVLVIFIIEIGLRICADGKGYFRKGWNIFDFSIVLISILAASSGLAVLRALRVLRVLRIITVIPRMRVVVSALLGSIPGIASVGVVLALIIYVFAVIAATLYGPLHPALFGDVFRAMYTLFNVMTLEGWPEIAAQVRATHPNSWIFFMTFILIATFTMLNLFVAIVVRVVEEDSETMIKEVLENQQTMTAEITGLRADIAKLSASTANENR